MPRLANVGRFGKRKARAEHQTATEHTQAVRAHLRDTWGGEPPRTYEAVTRWVARVAADRAEGDARVIDAAQAIETAADVQKATRQRHKQERFTLLVSELGTDEARRDQFGMHTVNPHRNAHDAQTRAAAARAEADELRSLPIADAARRIEAKHAEREHARQRAAERARQLRDPFEHNPHRDDLRREGPTHGL